VSWPVRRTIAATTKGLLGRYILVRRFVPALLRTIQFQGTSAGRSVLDALRFLHELEVEKHPGCGARRLAWSAHRGVALCLAPTTMWIDATTPSVRSNVSRTHSAAAMCSSHQASAGTIRGPSSCTAPAGTSFAHRSAVRSAATRRRNPSCNNLPPN
jgi:hypothetical protein